MTLTYSQAEVFRSIRLRLIDVKHELETLTNKLASACVHEDENDPDCPVCWVFLACSCANNALDDAPGHVEGALIRGPMPQCLN
jgi:hypothetical protein